MVSDELRCSVTELMGIFREALISVTPTAEALLLDWREAQSPHWENLAESLFDVCVRGPIEADAQREYTEFRLARYDIDCDSYSDLGWIGVRNVSTPMAVVRIITNVDPFDVVELVVLNPATWRPVESVTLPFVGTEFLFRRRRRNKLDVDVDSIVAVE